MKDNFYEVLGLTPTCSQNDVKSAYKKLAKKYHPDRNIDSIEEPKVIEDRFKLIVEAYSVLSDTQKRKEYDISLQGPENILKEELWKGIFSRVSGLNNWIDIDEEKAKELFEHSLDHFTDKVTEFAKNYRKNKQSVPEDSSPPNNTTSEDTSTVPDKSQNDNESDGGRASPTPSVLLHRNFDICVDYQLEHYYYGQYKEEVVMQIDGKQITIDIDTRNPVFFLEIPTTDTLYKVTITTKPEDHPDYYLPLEPFGLVRRINIPFTYWNSDIIYRLEVFGREYYVYLKNPSLTNNVYIIPGLGCLDNQGERGVLYLRVVMTDIDDGNTMHSLPPEAHNTLQAEVLQFDFLTPK
jgi:curved DNA-binding protein CbpA